MDAEVQNGENEENRVEEDEEVVRPMTPFAQGLTALLHVQVIEHQNPEGDGHVETGDGVVKWIMEGIEDRVPTLVVEQCVHSWNPRGGHFNVEEEIVRYGKGINQQVIEGDFVGHVSVA